jgi:hypothetical protein
MSSAPSHMNNQNFVFLQEQGTELKLSILGGFCYSLPFDKLQNGAVSCKSSYHDLWNSCSLFDAVSMRHSKV